MTDTYNLYKLNWKPFTKEERHNFIESYVTDFDPPLDEDCKESFRDRLHLVLQMDPTARLAFLLGSYVNNGWKVDASVEVRQKFAVENGRGYSPEELSWQNKGIQVMNGLIHRMLACIAEDELEEVWLLIAYLSEGLKWQMAAGDIKAWWCEQEGLCWGSPEWGDVEGAGPDSDWWDEPLRDTDLTPNFVRLFLPGDIHTDPGDLPEC